METKEISPSEVSMKAPPSAPEVAANTVSPKQELMSRADYKRVKGMNRKEMTDYLARVFKRGWVNGRDFALAENKEKTE